MVILTDEVAEEALGVDLILTFMRIGQLVVASNHLLNLDMVVVSKEDLLLEDVLSNVLLVVEQLRGHQELFLCLQPHFDLLENLWRDFLGLSRIHPNFAQLLKLGAELLEALQAIFNLRDFLRNLLNTALQEHDHFLLVIEDDHLFSFRAGLLEHLQVCLGLFGPTRILLSLSVRGHSICMLEGYPTVHHCCHTLILFIFTRHITHLRLLFTTFGALCDGRSG